MTTKEHTNEIYVMGLEFALALAEQHKEFDQDIDYFIEHLKKIIEERQ